jgi:cytochrome c oxidase subunit IV
MTESHAAAHAGPRFKDYMRTFYALMFLTVASYVVYVTMGHGLGAAGIILVLAIIKSSLIITIFMHLYFDWKKVYGIIIPVMILCVMSTMIFLVDQVMVWRHVGDTATEQLQAPRH